MIDRKIPDDAFDTNAAVRMYLALIIMRAWNHGTAGFCATVVDTINRWIDEGMNGPIPWPESPFFAEWAAGRDIKKVGAGYIGFHLRFKLKAVRA